MVVGRDNRRQIFATSVMIRNVNAGIVKSNQGFLNNSNGGTFTSGIAAGTLTLTLNGTAPAGTQALLDLTAHRFRIPHAGRGIGGDTLAWGTNTGRGGSIGDMVLGHVAGSGELGLNVNGTFFILQWPTAGGAVVCNPYVPGVA